MNDQAKTPRKLLELLADEQQGKELREKLKTHLNDVLTDYGVDPTDAVPPNYEPPSAERAQLALDLINKSKLRDEHGSPPWKTYALLVVVIGAIPFVADDAR